MLSRSLLQFVCSAFLYAMGVRDLWLFVIAAGLLEVDEREGGGKQPYLYIVKIEDFRPILTAFLSILNNKYLHRDLYNMFILGQEL